MWNPFLNKSSDDEGLNGDRKQHLPPVLDPLAGQSRKVRGRIAEVERMGTSAVATLTVTELTQEKGVELLAELLEELAQTGSRHFVLDIQNVQFMDSACLGCLVQALNAMAAKGGRIALANTANSVAYLFRMTQLDRVFPICADVMSALAAVEREPGAERG